MRFTTPPSAEDLIALAEDALAAIPKPLRDLLQGVAILVDDVADGEMLRELGIENPYELTGLYLGVPLTEKTSAATPAEPDHILLFREPILLEWVESGEDLFRLVRTVLIHEIGHHLGFLDEDIERLEKGE
ncbi:MAG: metallopeptidase family protein [Alphaproteobacteria bacterium]|nr:metallopeptidase family protein [Alphaproteobacteria bacterium]